jgi:anaerobic ribonucleoside-triphosphate reductase activating protein
VEPGELARLALSEAPLDGVTFSGGEPFAQAGPLAAFLDALPPEAKKTVIAFTGFYREELDRGDADQRELLRRVDLLVDGPYREDQPFEEASQAALRGSRNQRLVALTPAGEELKRRVEAAGGGGFGVLIAEDGEVIITGFPPPEALSRLRAALTRGK